MLLLEISFASPDFLEAREPGQGAEEGYNFTEFHLCGKIGEASKPRSRRKELILGGKRLILPKIGLSDPGLRLSSAFGGRRGEEATQEPRNSSGGRGSPSRTRMRSSSRGSSGACRGTWDASLVSDCSSCAQLKRAGTRVGSWASRKPGLKKESLSNHHPPPLKHHEIRAGKAIS
jgi:hypothetical protein